MSDTIPTTPRVAVLLKLAAEVSLEMGCSYVGTEHILLALFRINDGVGHRMLNACGADEARARMEWDLWADPTKALRERVADWQRKHDAVSAERDSLRSALSRCVELLTGIPCPHCGGQGFTVQANFHTGEPEQEQCRWCDERDPALTAAREALKGMP